MKSYTLFGVVIFGLWLTFAQADEAQHHIQERSLLGFGPKFKLTDLLAVTGLLPKKIKSPPIYLVGIVDQPVPSAVAVPSLPAQKRPAYSPPRPAYPPPAYPPAYPPPAYPPPAYPPPAYSSPPYSPPPASYPPPYQPSAYPAPSYPPPPSYPTPAAPYTPPAGVAKTQVISDSSTNSTASEKQLSDADALRLAALNSNSLAGQADSGTESS